MDDSITGAPGKSLSREQSALQNDGLANRLKLALLWLAVLLPLLWGVIKTLEDGGNLPM